MQQPKHLPLSDVAYANDRRVFVGGFVILLHVGFVAALAAGLGQIPKIDIPKILEGQVIIEKPADTDLPPPLTKFQLPQAVPTDVPPISTDWSDDAGITTTPTDTNNTTPAQAAHRIGGQAQPPYPPLSWRLNEQGAVLLQISLDASGAIDNVIVLQSSGYERLDIAARDWVMSHWRYQPAIRDGKAVASTIKAKIVFSLSDRR